MNQSNLEPETSPPRSKNALLHGIYASDNILPWESEADFEHLYQELRTEWVPEGRTEEEAVLALTRLHWLKHRLMRSTQLAFHRDPFVADLEKAGAKNWADVVARLKKEANAEDDLMDRVRQTLDELKDATKQASARMTAKDVTSQEIYSKVAGVQDSFHKLIPVYGEVYNRSRGPKSRNERGDDLYEDIKTVVEKAYHPDYLEKIIRLDASIDARIDKTLSRIAYIKAYKRVTREDAAKKIAATPSLTP